MFYKVIIIQVHGGTTEASITNFIKSALKIANHNSTLGLDTVVFFDEANTTESLGLIKEIMCDHRINGNKISSDIKFIAACNPYRK